MDEERKRLVVGSTGCQLLVENENSYWCKHTSNRLYAWFTSITTIKLVA